MIVYLQQRQSTIVPSSVAEAIVATVEARHCSKKTVWYTGCEGGTQASTQMELSVSRVQIRYIS